MSLLQVGQGARWAMALSVGLLAGAIAYFAMQIHKAVAVIDRIEPYLPALLQASDAWRSEVGKGLALAEKDFPKALDAVVSTQTYLDQVTPKVLAEITALRGSVDNQMPALLKQINAIEKQIPLVLAEVAEVRAAIPPVLNAIPPVLNESQALRREVPNILASADVLVGKAGEAGKEASQGAMKGVVSGVLRMPFDLLAGAGGFLLGGESLSKDEIDEFQKQAAILLKKGQAGSMQPYSMKTGMTGEITLLQWYRENNVRCAKLQVYAERKGKRGDQERLSACPDAKGDWHYLVI